MPKRSKLFFEWEDSKHENDKESNSNGTGFHDGPVFSGMRRKLFHNSNNRGNYYHKRSNCNNRGNNYHKRNN